MVEVPHYLPDSPEVLALPIGEMDAIHITTPGVILGPVKRGEPKATDTYFKPCGLWYGVGREWLDWIRAEHFHEQIGHIYRLHLNRSGMRMVRTVDALDKFNARYVRPEGSHSLNWPAVMLAYSGIEIAPYQYSRRFDLSWYYSWDVASGCVWDPSAVLGVEELL